MQFLIDNWCLLVAGIVVVAFCGYAVYGKLKLRYVYDMFVTKFPWLDDVISFEMVSMMVDDALEEMREMLETNKAVKEFVNGSTEETRKEQ